MTTASNIIDIAGAEVGYYVGNDRERGSKYGRWYAETHGAYYGNTGVPYCAMFVSWVFAQAKMTVPGLPFAYCPAGLNAGIKAGLKVATPQRGDIVYFDWNGGEVDHVGIVEKVNGNTIHTIEGNTSRGIIGSQSNGGYVARRTRTMRNIKGIIRPAYKQKVKKGKKAMFTFRADNGGGIWYYDGTLHPLHHEHELEALRMAFKKAGYELPHIDIGTKKEPWGTRLLDALTRTNTHITTLK